MRRVVAIDGPSGSGKSSVAKLLAKELGILYIDTGAMYRALAYAACERGVAFTEGLALQEFFGSIVFEYGKENSLVSVDGEDLSLRIREHRISRLASDFSRLPSVREFLLDIQRDLPGSRTCVMEGRDIGTAIFPDAFCKFFVTASLETRAKRRLGQLRELGDDGATLDQIIEDQKKRDENDANRAVAPLKRADDAEAVDTEPCTLEEVVVLLAGKVRARAQKVGLAL